MKGDDLPPEDHVLRHCSSRLLKIDHDSGDVLGVFWFAFEPDGEGISVTWVEYFRGSTAERLVAAREAIARTRKLRTNHRLAKLNVGNALEAGRAIGVPTRVVHDPDQGPPENVNPAHSIIIMKGESAHLSDLQNRLANLVISLEAALE